jgi:hypothetical protein
MRFHGKPDAPVVGTFTPWTHLRVGGFPHVCCVFPAWWGEITLADDVSKVNNVFRVARGDCEYWD